MEHICSLKSFPYCLRIYNIQSLNVAKFKRIQLFVKTGSLLSTRKTCLHLLATAIEAFKTVNKFTQ